MSRSTPTFPCFALLSMAVACTALAEPAGESYYKEPPSFHYYPSADSPRSTIGRFGPVGISLDLLQPAFTMRIAGVEAGSPAAATGQLRKGQYIESINGKVLKDIDPRIILGDLITEAEAKDGKIVMMIKDTRDAAAYPVTVQLPVLGAYSETWPISCTKSDRIVRIFADYLGRTDSRGWGAALFLLSTGEEKDLAVVRRWFSGKLNPKGTGHPWAIGYTGPAICEYYLRTGDESVLPAIKSRCDYLTRTIYNGSWMGRGAANYGYMAGGHMNAAGVHATTFLLMAKECGVDVDEHTLQTSLQQFFRYAGRGNVPYGDGLPEGGMTDNGRVGGLAFTMQAAANLTPEGEASVYARARDISATKSFYSTSWLFHGHTGGGIGELWRGPAMGLVKEKRPAQYRTFMDGRCWMYELARTHEGAFGWSAGQNVSYTQVSAGKPCGNYIPLIYTLPRKKLRLYGAPPTTHSKTYQLPKRPWGTGADDIFYSLQAGEYAPGKRLDVSQETLDSDTSMKIFRRIGAEDVSDEVLLEYVLHIDQGIRSSAARKIIDKGRLQLIPKLLNSGDPRGRRSGLEALSGAIRSGNTAVMTDEAVAAVAGMITDPQESWWVVEAALNVFANAKPSQIAPLADRLAYWLRHDEWWLRKAALVAVTPIVGDQRYAKQILPIVGEMIANNERAVALSPVRGIVEALRNASPDIQQFGVKALGQAYSDFPETLAAPGGQNMSSGAAYLLRGIASNLASAPGGFDMLYQVSRQRFPDEPLPHLDIYMKADPSQFGPVVKKAFEPLMRDLLIWQYVADNLRGLESEVRSQQPGRATGGLVDLYQKVGVTDYNWRLWGPRRDKIEWQYYSYDPKETKLWEKGSRYRQVSWPVGADEWMQPGFDAQRAGWQTGFAPFAHNDGELAPLGGCVGEDHFCGCGNPPNTLWEKEVLLMCAELKLPPMREGYAYRLLVGGRSHVGSGDGSDVWINGKRKEQRRPGDPSLSGVGKRAGGQPWGFVIDDEFRKQFTGDTVTIAATGFLPIHKSGVKRNYQAFWFEEMKLPSLEEKEVLEVLEITPLRTSVWQTSLDESDMFQSDGTFDENRDILGGWVQLGKVDSVDFFNPAVRLRVDRKAPFKELAFKENGRTADPYVMYSGDLLLDTRSKQGLKMTTSTIGDTDYLFIEAGGFKADQVDGWETAYYVMKRATK